VLNNGAPVTLTPWLKNVPALLDAWFPGQEGGHALAAILFGDINPSGKLPCTFGARREDYPDYGNFPGTKGIVKYPEGIYVGYRHFDKNRIDPVYPFGYGLSYTTFAYSNLRFSKPALAARGRVNALVDIANTGKRKGAEVVELYVRDPAPRVDRPVRELKGFAKIDLAPGQKGTVSIPLSGRSLAFCDVPGKCWRAYKGAYEIEVGASSRDLRLRAKLKLAANYAEPVAHMGQAPPPPERLADMEKRLKLVDLAKGCPATASTQEKKDTTPSAAFDGDDSTYWSSAFKDPQWLQVDLGKPTMVGGVGIDWTIAYSTTYRIQTSMDGAQWKDVYSTTQGQGEVEILHFKPVSARYVRFYGEKRASKWGHAFYTFAVYGR